MGRGEVSNGSSGNANAALPLMIASPRVDSPSLTQHNRKLVAARYSNCMASSTAVASIILHPPNAIAALGTFPRARRCNCCIGACFQPSITTTTTTKAPDARGAQDLLGGVEEAALAARVAAPAIHRPIRINSSHVRVAAPHRHDACMQEARDEARLQIRLMSRD